eukprot:891751-Prymnesium_polylepis.3
MLDTLVAPGLSTYLASQSWLNSGGPIGGFCPDSGHDVVDIQKLFLPEDDTHVTQVDHSKWAVANSTDDSWWCALDNNHVESQETRSGLAVCQMGGFSVLLRTTAVEVGTCGTPSPPSPSPSGSCCFYSDASCSESHSSQDPMPT